MLVGIDPGLTGAVAILGADGTVEALTDTPTLTLKVARGTKQVYDVPGMCGLLRGYTGGGLHVVIEQAQAMQGKGLGACLPSASATASRKNTRNFWR